MSHTMTMTASPPKHQRIRSHLASWVMLSPTTNPPYTPLPNEQNLFTSPPRIAFSLTTPAHYPGKQQAPLNISSSTGILYLTNRRILYLPDKPTEKLKSFSAPILNIHDSHVTAPFFGPNVWQALLQPVQGGGIPVPSGGVVELKLTFKDGGAFDFSTHFERVKERLQQAVEVARIDGDGAGSSRAAMNGVNVANVDLEDLPAYQEASDGPLMAPIAATAASAASVATPRSPAVQQSRDSLIDVEDDRPQPKSTDSTFSPPAEPPPGYEEAQMQGLQDEMERRMSNAR